ncbi:hypothetical protein HQ945_00970 [Phyllobacterium sp. BT25]|uniref:Uncharacterized protein n=1 Tax=Phyllobacterium pellucidum TaxID=2740464 RepID=A0A849VPD4_9HYPH|nr:hypothetical protein [Phyllobacterium pellucidum]NTS29813.1 hypothetical protein [Phyllobacterium pellucidum]
MTDTLAKIIKLQNCKTLSAVQSRMVQHYREGFELTGRLRKDQVAYSIGRSNWHYRRKSGEKFKNRHAEAANSANGRKQP